MLECPFQKPVHNSVFSRSKEIVEPSLNYFFLNFSKVLTKLVKYWKYWDKSKVFNAFLVAFFIDGNNFTCLENCWEHASLHAVVIQPCEWPENNTCYSFDNYYGYITGLFIFEVLDNLYYFIWVSILKIDRTFHLFWHILFIVQPRDGIARKNLFIEINR